MKASILILTLFSASIALGEITDITISSFVRLGSQSISAPMLAEVCGHVSGDLPGIVTITVDPNAKPGNYTTLTDAVGNYCQTVATYAGRVEVRATSLHQNHSSPSPIKTATIGKLRK